MRPLALLLAALLTAIGTVWLLRARLRRAGRRALLRFRARVDRYKFAPRAEVVEALLRDAVIAEAVSQHAAASRETVEASWARVRRYLDEIVPQFNVLAYYQLGYRLANTVLAMFWKCSVHSATPGAVARLPRDAHVVYLINHRSNADYVLVAWALAGQVSISYAVGEWARAFPLEFLFKRFGSYFIRRGYREVLYHTVLERYVQHITVQGVTQGIFPEGGLTRDGRLRPGKIGLLDYLVGTGRDRTMRERLVLVPVALNYDRVLEDRTLLRELRARETASGFAPPSLAPPSAVPPGAASERTSPERTSPERTSPERTSPERTSPPRTSPPRTSPPRTPLRDRLAQAAEVGRFVAWNAGRALTGRWRRYGRAAVVVGDPIPLADWFADEDRRAGGDLFALPRDARLARVQALCDTMLTRIGAIIPVTPVPLACAAIQSLDADVIPRARLLERMEAMRDVLLTLNGSVLRADRDIADTFDIAYRMLRLRRVLSRHGDSYVVLERGRELVSYYANSVAHLLGDFEAGVRARDALPVERAIGGT